MQAKNSGFYIIALMLVIVFLAAIVLRYSSQLTNNHDMSARKTLSNYAINSAYTGLEVANFVLNSPELVHDNVYIQRDKCAGFNRFFPLIQSEILVYAFNNYDFASSLSADINATSTVIPVASLSGFGPSGRVIINSEAIDYFGTSTSTSDCNGELACLTSLKRGRDSTVARAHPTGSSVSQYQCDVVSFASSPAFATSLSQRILRRPIQLQKAWIAGESDTMSGHVSQFDGKDWGTATGVPSVDIRSISANNYADAWAVGLSGTLLHFDGSTWSDQSIPAITNNLYAVECIRTNLCWAAGLLEKFYLYDGVTWELHESNSTGTIKNISCPSAGFCKAVGPTGYVFRFPTDPFTTRNWQVVNLPGSYALNDVHCFNANLCWAVGDSEVILKWDGTSWLLEKDDGTKNLYAIHCASTTDCWAAGENKHFWHYDGSNWVLIEPTTVPDETYRDITCYTKNDCWAVGDEHGMHANVVHFNGTVWSNVPLNHLPGKDLFAIDAVGSHGYSATYNDDVIR